MATMSYALVDEPSSWAKGAIESLKLTGEFRDEAFTNYKDNTTRGEFIYLAVRTYELIKNQEIEIDSAIEFTDTNDIYALKGASIGITGGIGGGKFGMNQYLTREQLAVLMINVMKLSGLTLSEPNDYTFSDEMKFNSWAKDSIYLAKANGIISGTGDNSFNPSGSATVEQSLIIAHKILTKQQSKDGLLQLIDFLEMGDEYLIQDIYNYMFLVEAYLSAGMREHAIQVVLDDYAAYGSTLEDEKKSYDEYMEFVNSKDYSLDFEHVYASSLISYETYLEVSEAALYQPFDYDVLTSRLTDIDDVVTINKLMEKLSANPIMIEYLTSLKEEYKKRIEKDFEIIVSDDVDNLGIWNVSVEFAEFSRNDYHNSGYWIEYSINNSEWIKLDSGNYNRVLSRYIIHFEEDGYYDLSVRANYTDSDLNEYVPVVYELSADVVRKTSTDEFGEIFSVPMNAFTADRNIVSTPTYEEMDLDGDSKVNEYEADMYYQNNTAFFNSIVEIDNGGRAMNFFSSLRGIEYYPNLKTLSINIDGVGDLSPFENLVNLEKLYLSGNFDKNADVSYLYNLPKLNYSAE